MRTVTTVRDLREALVPWREGRDTVALVPTMGALHDGHISLLRAAKKMAQRAVVSIFVNPLQFGPNEDLAKYPRPLDDDRKMLEANGCDLLYAPPPAEIYPEGFVTKIDPGPLANVLEGVVRPGHFGGVATVVAKLLLQAMPDCALFGEKDYQQLMIIRRMVRDLNIPIHIVACPLMRDADGLALSSRNAYLSPEQRKQAAVFPAILTETVQQLEQGKAISEALKEGRDKLMSAGFKCDYLELRDAGTLAPAHDLTLPARLLGAVRIGPVRLIDNMGVGGG
ncbi:MAG: pantoate--beta-alanine ligase [Bdellovibrionales bacterium]